MMTTTMPEDYDSDDLDRLVAEADRKAAKLRHVDTELSVSANDELEGLRAGARAVIARRDRINAALGYEFVGEYFGYDNDEDDGYRYDPVTGESRLYKEA